jgi:predicted flap endonuclease-1-like 5' DNA nuclease
MSTTIWSGAAAGFFAAILIAAGVAAGFFVAWLIGRNAVRQRSRDDERGQRALEIELKRLREETREGRAVQGGLLSALDTMRRGLQDSEQRLASAEAELAARDAAATADPAAFRAKPRALPAPVNGLPDDLQRIAGIGPQTESILNGLGVFHFDQIAAWSAEETAYVEAAIATAGGVVIGEDWVGQASRLSRRRRPEFSNAVDDSDMF